jgi:hypothetical protein
VELDLPGELYLLEIVGVPRRDEVGKILEAMALELSTCARRG